MAKNWKDELRGRARVSGVLEVKVKMRRFGEKEMMGRRVGWGQSRARL